MPESMTVSELADVEALLAELEAELAQAPADDRGLITDQIESLRAVRAALLGVPLEVESRLRGVATASSARRPGSVN